MSSLQLMIRCWRTLLCGLAPRREKVMVRLSYRCTVIKSQWVLVTPAGSLCVLETWAMTEGGDDEAKPPYAGSTRRWLQLSW